MSYFNIPLKKNYIVHLYSENSPLKDAWFVQISEIMLCLTIDVNTFCQPHYCVITDLEPDILECEVKWALESITTKLVEVMEFQLSYFKSWKMMLWKCCTQYDSKFGKLSSGHRTGKGQYSFQSQRKAMPKNAQTTAQLHSSHTLVK